MAAYTALVANANADVLRQQIKMAIAMSALAITNEVPATTNHANRLIWAKNALGNPDGEVNRIVWHVLAANAAATIAQINTATDAQVQTGSGRSGQPLCELAITNGLHSPYAAATAPGTR